MVVTLVLVKVSPSPAASSSTAFSAHHSAHWAIMDNNVHHTMSTGIRSPKHPPNSYLVLFWFYYVRRMASIQDSFPNKRIYPL